MHWTLLFAPFLLGQQVAALPGSSFYYSISTSLAIPSSQSVTPQGSSSPTKTPYASATLHSSPAPYHSSEIHRSFATPNSFSTLRFSTRVGSSARISSSMPTPTSTVLASPSSLIRTPSATFITPLITPSPSSTPTVRCHLWLNVAQKVGNDIIDGGICQCEGIPGLFAALPQTPGQTSWEPCAYTTTPTSTLSLSTITTTTTLSPTSTSTVSPSSTNIASFYLVEQYGQGNQWWIIDETTTAETDICSASTSIEADADTVAPYPQYPDSDIGPFTSHGISGCQYTGAGGNATGTMTCPGVDGIVCERAPEYNSGQMCGRLFHSMLMVPVMWCSW